MNFETRDQSKWWPSSGFLNIFFCYFCGRCMSKFYIPAIFAVAEEVQSSEPNRSAYAMSTRLTTGQRRWVA